MQKEPNNRIQTLDQKITTKVGQGAAHLVRNHDLSLFFPDFDGFFPPTSSDPSVCGGESSHPPPALAPVPAPGVCDNDLSNGGLFAPALGPILPPTLGVVLPPIVVVLDPPPLHIILSGGEPGETSVDVGFVDVEPVTIDVGGLVASPRLPVILIPLAVLGRRAV